MKKILFVCLGNICRSPLAEGVMLHLKEKYKLDIEIDSAGTSSYHVGEAPDSRTILSAKKNGIDLSSLRARQFQTSDFDNFDKIFVMDKSNLQNVLHLSKNETQSKKVCLLLEQSKSYDILEVPDPYFGGEEGFDLVYRLIYDACENIRLQLSS